MENRNVESEISLVITRVLPFPRETVFRAWCEPEQLKNWFCPGGYKTPFAEMDARKGGKHRIGMDPPEGGGVHYAGGVMTEFSPPERISFTWRWEGEALDSGESLVTVELRPKGDGTEITLTHERFASEESKNNHNQGWQGCLDNLQRMLAA